MFIVGIYSWWYSAGWRKLIERVQNSLLNMYDTFSLGLLLKTLFSPWRQISAGRVRGSISVQMRAFFDRLVSRIIGGFIRSVVLIFGSIFMVCAILIGLLRIVLWPIVPIVPFLAIIAMIGGWIPWHL